MKNKEKEKEKIIEENVKIMQKYLENLNRDRFKLSNSLDKYLLSFATGSLYLSILFTSQLSNSKDLVCNTLLLVGWILLLVCIVSTLTSIYFAIKAYEDYADLADQNIKAEYNSKEYTPQGNFWESLLGFLSVVSIICFMVGILLLTVFYFINIFNG